MGTLSDSHLPSARFFQKDQGRETHNSEYDRNPLRLTAFIRVQDQDEPGDPEQEHQTQAQHPLGRKDSFPEPVIERFRLHALKIRKMEITKVRS